MAAPGWPYRPWEWVRIIGGTAILQTLSVATAAVTTLLTAATAKLGGASHYTEFEADGTLKCVGDATTWDDINIPAFGLGAGATAPDLVAFLGAGDLKILAFDGNATAEQLYGASEITHKYKQGTNITPHVHWVPTTTNAGNVKWQFEYSWGNNSGAVFGASTTISAIQAAGGTAWAHKRADFPAITGTDKNIGSAIVFRVFRDPADGDDTYPDDAGLIQVGIHFEQDTLGSRSISTK